MEPGPGGSTLREMEQGPGGITLEEMERCPGPRTPAPRLRPGPGGVVLTAHGKRVFVHGATGGRQATVCFPHAVLDVQLEEGSGRLLALCHGGAVYSLPAGSSGDGWSDRDVSEMDAILVAPEAVTLLLLPCAGAPLLATLGGSRPWDVRWWRLPAAGADSSCRSEPLGRVALPHCRVEATAWPRAGVVAATPRPLPIVASLSAASPSGPATPGSIQLQPALFELLLGVDAAMLGLSALLCGLPDGRVYAIPAPGSGVAAASSRCAPAPRPVPPPLRTRPVLLHDLRQPPVLAASAPRAEGAGGRDGRDCLVLVGAEGEVVLATRDDGPRGALVVRELHVQGPVLAACCHGDRLLYSSPRGVFSVLLTAAEKDAEEGGAPAPVPLPIKLYDCCALALCCTPRPGEGGEERVVVVTAQRRLVSFGLPCGSTGDASRRRPASRPGHAARDLLSAISGVSERVRVASEALRRQDRELRRLRLCSDVCRRMSAPVGAGGRLRGDGERPLELRVSALWTRSLREERPGLRCELLAGARGGGLRGPWMLCVEVSGAGRRPPGRAAALARVSAAHAFPVEELPAGGHVEVSVPLGCDGAPLELLPVPVTVRCFLHSGLPLGEPRRTPPELDGASLATGGVTLPVGCAAVDALSWLRPALRGGPRVGEAPAESAREADGGGAAPTVLAVRVSEATANTILGPAASGAATGPCRALLARLLSESPGLPGPEPLPGPPGGPAAGITVDAVAADGCPVRLAVTQVQVNSEPVLEVSITCASLVSLCALHLAVTRRLQCGERAGSARPATGSLRGDGAIRLTAEAYPRLQALLAEVQALRDAPGAALRSDGGEGRELRLYLRARAARVPLLL